MDSSVYAGLDLSKVPARQPPAGQTSNLVDPPSSAYRVTICNALCLVVVLTFFGLRMWTRIKIVKAVGYDDCVICLDCNALALLCWLATAIAFQYATRYGVGRHLWNVSLADLFPHVMQLWVIAAMLYSITMMVIKLSILAMYRRLFIVDNFLIRWWAVVIFTVGYSLGGFFASLFQCWPIQSTWSMGMKPEHCIHVGKFYIANAVLNIISDLLILALPIPIVWGLNLRFRQKMILTVLFVLGSFSCVVSVMRLVYVIQIDQHTSDDVTWGLLQVLVSSQGELTAAMVCACVPCLRPFFERYTPWLFSTLNANYAASTKEPYLPTIPTSTRKTGRNSANQGRLAYDDDQIELGPTHYKTEAEITVSQPDSDSESTQEILHHERCSDSGGNDRIMVRSTYNVKSIYEV